MVGLLDFFTGGDPEQMAQIDPRYGVPRSDVRDAAVNTLGNISALLLAAGQPITPAQRAQLIAQIGPAAAGGGTDLYNAAQRRLMTAQVEQRRSEAEDIRRLDELRRNPEAFRAATGQDVSQFTGMSTRDMSQALRQIAIERAKPRQPTGGLEGEAQAFVLQAQRNPALLDTPEYAVFYTRLYGPRVEIRDGQVVQIQPPVPPGIFPPTQRAAAAAAAAAADGGGGQQGPQGQGQPGQAPQGTQGQGTQGQGQQGQGPAPVMPAAQTGGAPIDLRRPTTEGAPTTTPVAPMSLAALQDQALRRQLAQRGVEVTVPTPRQDYRYTPDLGRVEPIPGSPAETSETRRRESETRGGNIVVRELNRALDLMDTAILPTVGFGATTMSRVPGTAASDLSSLIETVRARVGFQELNRMRQESPTGGALGDINRQELSALQNALGSLNQTQSPAQFRENVNNIREMFLDIIHGPGNRPPGTERPRRGGTTERPAVETQRPGEIRTQSGIIIRPIQ